MDLIKIVHFWWCTHLSWPQYLRTHLVPDRLLDGFGQLKRAADLNKLKDILVCSKYEPIGQFQCRLLCTSYNSHSSIGQIYNKTCLADSKGGLHLILLTQNCFLGKIGQQTLCSLTLEELDFIIENLYWLILKIAIFAWGFEGKSLDIDIKKIAMQSKVINRRMIKICQYLYSSRSFLMICFLVSSHIR